MPTNKFMKSKSAKSVFHSLILGLALLLLFAANSYGSVSAGYSEYYIPGDELNMWTVFDTLDDAGANTTMHAVISVTAWSDNTTLYYDHWEHCKGITVGSPGCANGYNFDPDNPAATADEIVIFPNAGGLEAFESSNIPTAPRGTGTYYDGGDRIYVAGGAVTVTRASWIEAVGVGNQSAAWEIYPVKPQLTTYVLPFGENLGFADFNRVFVLIQATEDNTTFQVDLNGDGTYDTLNQNRDGDKTDALVDTDTVMLQRGKSFLLDRTSACLNGGILCGSDPGDLNSGILIQGNKTLQVKFVAGNPGQNYCARGFSAFPRGFWTKDYYAPVDQPTGGAADTDYYLHNPNSAAITLSWESLASSGSFSIPPKNTVSFRTASGGSVPVDSGLYLSGSDVFWGVGVGDAGSNAYEWGFSLLPSTMLYPEHFLGWAPGSIPAINPGDRDNDGVFLSVAQDNTRVWIDFNNDGASDLIDADGNGTPESPFVTLDRLQSQFIYNPNSGDLSQAHFWATGPFTMAYGENADTATTSTPSLDLGYVAIPGTDFISLVLTVDKSVNPQVVNTASGSEATFTIAVNSQKYTVDGIMVLDMLPAGWEYLGSTSITLPDMTTIATAPDQTPAGSALPAPFSGTCPAGGGGCLTWDNTVLGDMAENQEITITFTGRTTQDFSVGDLSQNQVEAVGIRELGTPPDDTTQTFTATAFAFNSYGDMTVTKTSDADDPLYPGDMFTYTVTVTNPASAASNQTGISVYDPLPAGISYLADSSQVTLATTVNVLDQFGAVAYTNNNGSVDWSTDWTETDSYGTGPAGTGAGAAGGFVWITGGQLQFRYLLSTVRDEFTTDSSYAENYGSDNWANNWTETGDGITGPTAGNILIDNGGDQLYFIAAQVNDAISRTATVTGATSATFNFTLTDGGIDGGETMIAEYSRDGGGYLNLGTYDGGTGGWSGVPQTFTIALAGNNSLTLRFRVAGGNYDSGERVNIDNVQIAYNTPVDASGTQVQRTADLTGATSATLTFTSAGANLGAGDTMVVEASSTGNPGSFTPLATATGNAAFAPAGPYDLTSYISANTTIRFRTTGGYNATNETRSIDNVDISMSGVFTLPAGNAPNFVSSSSGYSLTPGQQMTLTYNVTVDDPLAAGIDQITNTAYANSNEIILPISASVTNIVVNPNSQSASVGDRVWFDVDGDGVFDIGEPGLSNVEVTLKDQFGLPLLTTITDVTGHYLFTGLLPGGIGYYVEVTGGLPSGIIQSAPSGRTDNRTNSFDLRTSSGNNRDQFGAVSYSNNDGSVNWTTNPWVETDNTGGGAVGGEIRITGGELRINSDTATGNSIYRPLNIPAGSVAATLSFDWRTQDVETTDSIVLEISEDGVNYTTLVTFTGLDEEVSGSQSIDITGYLSAATRIRFRTTAFYTATDDYFYVDNVNVEYYSHLTEYLGADIGYAPAAGTATFGDTVWSDFDGDGIRDLGEPGLAGITVQLCPDTNGNLFWDVLADVPCISTVTAPGGYYLFTGVAATGSEDYFVVVVTTQTGLSGFSGTTVNPLLVENVSLGDVTMNLDFGFENPTGTYTIKDRIWYDANTDEQDDGETGIAGVTLDLLDASLNVIATTITDANGYFTFSGVLGSGADYTVSITDTGGVLDNYYGVTDEAVAGEVEVSNLSGNLDSTVEPTEPSFGYGLTRSISGTIFNDLNGNGSLASPETGMAGITVRLYSDDGDGVLDGGDTLQATLTTDSNGNYLFAGLANGPYIVSIPTPPSGYNYTTEQPPLNNDNDPAAGHQQTATVTSGGNVQDLNFGYQSSIPTSVSGQLWKDTDADGMVDAGETSLEGITLELLSGSTVVASTTTDVNGNYTFSGLTSAIYTVRVTDTLGALAGYDATYEFDVGTAGPFNGEASADLTGGNLTAANFGFTVPSVITLAVISDFKASVVDGIVVISWDTIYEKGTIGFYLYRRDDASGEYIRVNDKLIPGLVFAPRGGSYRMVDNDALPGRTYSYQLVEIEAKNTKEKRNIYGPFQVTALEIWGPHSGEMSVSAPFSRIEHPVPEATKDRLAARDISLRSLPMKGTASAKIAAPAVHPLMAKRKIGVNESGLYYIDLSELPFAWYIGKWSNVTAYAISSQVMLKNKGQQVPYFIANDNKGVYFYGEDIESIYTDTNVYWAERGRGTLMQTVTGKGPLPAVDGQTFIDTVHIEENTLPIIAVVTDPTADYWAWGEDFIYAGYPGFDSQSFTFSTYGTASVDAATTLTVHLYGLTDSDHHAEIWLNNEYAGEGRWSGIHPESFTFSVNQSLLKNAADGENVITVRGLLDGGVLHSFITVDSFDLSYHREYKAIDNTLFITGGTNTTVSVEGFSVPEIFVLDVSDATKPKRINAITIDTIGPDNYRVSFVPSTPQTRYLVTSLPGLKTPVSSSIDTPSSLQSRSHNAAYLLITSNELKETAGNLSRYRLQKALTTELVDIEDIMDEFNYGIFSPEAIRNFLAYAYKNWGRSLRYAVLIGEGTYDYKNYSGMGGNFVPPLMVSTPDGIVVSDTALADIDGDHLPEIAIGRLPVLTPEELEAVISKIIAFETATDKSWRNRIVMMADHPEGGADFPLDSDSVAALLPQGYDVSRIYMSQQSITSARTLLTNALLNGAGLINYVGHGGPDRLEQDGLLKNSDVAFLTNTKLPLLTAMTCAAGDFSQPGYDSLAELLLIKQDGGAIAVWSPSGFSTNEEAIVMDKEFFRSRFINTPARTLLGDIVLAALENAKKNGVSDYMLEIYNIIGDPALMLR